MYVIFKEDKLLKKIWFWSRNDIYEHQLFDDTKYIFPIENAASQIADHVTLLPSSIEEGFFVNYNHVPLESTRKDNIDFLKTLLTDNNIFFFTEGSLNLERYHLINITLDIDYIMQCFKPNIISGRFNDYVKEELLNKQSILRDYTINQILK